MSEPKITVAPGIDVPQETLLKLAGDYYLPGEQVRLDAATKFSDESEARRSERATLLGDRTLTVKETRVDRAPDGDGFLVGYVFEGVDGLHNVKAFCGPQPYKHLYGVLITRDAQTWFVPLNDGGSSAGTAESPLRVSPKLPRSACYSSGVADPILVALGQYEMHGLSQSESAELAKTRTPESFFADLEGDPMAGEFVLSAVADSDEWMLEYAPWTTSPGEDEIAQSEAAIREKLAQATAPRI